MEPFITKKSKAKNAIALQVLALVVETITEFFSNFPCSHFIEIDDGIPI